MHFYEGEKNADMLLVLEIEQAAPLLQRSMETS